MGILSGKVAVITGAGGGIGRGHALYFAREGARVVVNDLGGSKDGTGSGSEMADGVVKEIISAGGEAVANYDDISKMEGGRNVIQAALDKWGRIDILINNAGILRDHYLLKLTEEMWDIVIRVHLKGTFACTQAAVNAMRGQYEKLADEEKARPGSGGRIINTTSIAGLIGNPAQANYGTAKAGLMGFTFVLSQELQRWKINVNAIAPIALTRMTQGLPFMAGVSEEQLGPQHIAPVAAFLASDLGADVNGQVVGVWGPRVYAFKVQESQGTVKPSGLWTPQEVKEKWAQITGF